MSATPVVSPEAAADLREIADYIAEDNPPAARRVVAELRRSIQRLGQTPGMGHRRDDLSREQVRFWPVGRYLVIYRSSGRAVEIIRVLHSARDVAALLSTL